MTPIDLPKLRKLIGCNARYKNSQWVIIEVLEQPLAVVLQQTDEASAVQSNQYGEAKRRAPNTTAVTVLTSDQGDFSSDFLDIDIKEVN